MELNLKSKDWEFMRAHVEACAPLEACGLLAGKNDRVEKILLVENQAKSRVRFRMDPKEQLKAFNWIDSNELDLVGIFHSHPAGPATVSTTDIAEASYAVTQIIWSQRQGDWIALGFWIGKDQITEVNLKII
jgi:proteasome lid subunit RPN8/RPN11